MPERSYPPSTYAIEDLIEGRPGGLPRTLVLTAARTLAIAPGLYLAGQRRDVVRTSFYVSGTITLGMLLVKSLGRRT